jgi:hypothetical protein
VFGKVYLISRRRWLLGLIKVGSMGRLFAFVYTYLIELDFSHIVHRYICA